MKSKQFCLHVILPLLVGSLLYIVFRSKSLRMFSWFDEIGISRIILSVRSVATPFKSIIPEWVYFSFPDGLWVYSFSSAYLIIWKNDFSLGRWWLLLPLMFGCLVEIAQGLGIFTGTFDIIDLVFCSLAILSSILVLKQPFKNYEKRQ